MRVLFGLTLLLATTLSQSYADTDCGQPVNVNNCPHFANNPPNQQIDLCVNSGYCDPYRCDPNFLTDLPGNFTCGCTQLVLSPNAQGDLYNGDPWDYVSFSLCTPTDPGTTGCPIALFSDSSLSVVYSDCPFPIGCFGQVGILRIWRVVDGLGQAVGCPLTQLIFIIPDNPATVQYPPSVTIGTNDSRDPSATGYPTITGDCGVVSNVADYLVSECDDGIVGPQICYSDAETPGTCPGSVIITRTWTVRDFSCIDETGQQTITVGGAGPTLHTPADRNVNCGSSTDPSVTGQATSDDVSATITYSDATVINGCSNTIVRTWTATSACGSTNGIQNIHLIDTTAPSLSCPPDVLVTSAPDCTSSGVNLGSPTVTDCSAVTVTNNAPVVFPAGCTTVTWTATDACGNVSSCYQHVTVVVPQAAHVTASVGTTMLWPPNHDLINVGLGVTVNDPCNPSATATVTVYSNEPDTGLDDNERHSPDAKNIASGTLRLRSERSGNGTARVYLVVVRATGSSGTSGLACSTVVVPHSRSAAALQAATNLAASAQATVMTTGNPPSGYVQVGTGPVIGPKQ